MRAFAERWVLTGVGRDEGGAALAALATDTRVTRGHDNGHTRSRKLLSGSAHGRGLDRGEVALERAVREGDDAGARRRRDAEEVLEGEEEDITRGEDRADVVEGWKDQV